MSALLIPLFSTCLLACSPASEPRDLRVMACLGDSNTCFGSPGQCGPIRSWCERLAEALPEIRVVNLAWSGATACEGSDRPSLARQYATSQEEIEPPADLVIMAFGTNDYLQSSPGEVLQCYRDVAQRARKDGVHYRVATTPPVFGNERRGLFVGRTNALIREALPYVEFHEGFDDPRFFFFPDDPIHLNESGQELRAQRAMRAVEELSR